jgi:tetratricopeptide (TPR) repeat protein
MGSKKQSSGKPGVSSKAKLKKPEAARTRADAKGKTKAPAKAAKTAKAPLPKKAAAGAEGKVRVVSKPAETPRLLPETKSTTAALALLEKSIKLIYQKEFKRARAELKTLIDNHPGEAEILARARTYLQICEREDAAHKKQAASTDQLYNLGVIEHNRTNYDKAISYFHQSLEKHPNSEHVYYSLAASLAMKGDLGEALRNLQKAVELNEENRVYAKNDSDFAPLHAQKEFSDIVGWSQPVAGGQS